MILNYANRDAARLAWQAHFHDRSVRDAKTGNNGNLQILNADSGTVEILLYDEIGLWGVTARQFVTALAGITASSILVRINSPGGDVFDGLAIYNALRAHPATVDTVIEGIAASAASFVALAGKTVSIAPAAFMMIHKAWALTMGNADDHRDMTAVLDKIDGQLADIYAKKSGKGRGDMLALMKGPSDGTWFTADEAKAMGLVDVIADPTQGPDVLDPGEDQQTAGGAEPDGPIDLVSPESRIKQMRRRLMLAVHE